MPLPRLVLAAALLAGGCKARPPHVLLVTVDTLRADHCSLYGYPRPTTPELDRLAAGGIVYDQATATASYTMASVGTILTGEYPWKHGANAHPSLLADRSETLAEALAARGYQTLAVVTNPILKSKHGFAQGFGTYVERNMQLEAGAPVQGAAGKTTDLAIEALEQARALPAPVFLWVHYMDPHWWYTPPPPFDTAFAPPDPAWDAFHRGTLDGSIPVDQVYFQDGLPPAVRDRGIALYDGEIAYTDREIGRLLSELERRGLREETLIAVTADHGESLGQHGITFCHGFFAYEDNLRVPLVIVPPRSRAVPPQRDASPTSLVELKGTILWHLGLGERPRGSYDVVRAFPVVGESEPLYDPATAKRSNVPGRPRAHVFGEPGKWRTYREGPLKLVLVPRTAPGAPDVELYDLSADPDEQHDLADARPEDRDRLRAALTAVVPALAPGGAAP